MKMFERLRCSKCSKVFSLEGEFRDVFFIHEYYWTGMCQACQDKAGIRKAEDTEDN